MILPESRALIESHQIRGDTCIIITATNDFITAPIAKELGVDILIATQLETIAGKLTGKIQGEPCYQEGKVKKLAVWMQQSASRGHHFDLSSAVFYTDSINDLPLLKKSLNRLPLIPMIPSGKKRRQTMEGHQFTLNKALLRNRRCGCVFLHPAKLQRPRQPAGQSIYIARYR